MTYIFDCKPIVWFFDWIKIENNLEMGLTSAKYDNILT